MMMMATIVAGASANLGPFSYTFMDDDESGVYHVLAGLRIYPWEPAVEFRGTNTSSSFTTAQSNSIGLFSHAGGVVTNPPRPRGRLSY